MNTLVIVLIAAVCLVAGYVFYGRWLANKWGIDPKAQTPAVKKNDGQDFVPTEGWTVFAHQFSSIAGAGPVTGAIQAAVFGWLPVLLWILIGGIFFGAVTDFGALYASVKNEGKSMGLLIEKYIGKTGRKLFLVFCWLFTLIVTAAFADMVADTFNAYTVTDGVSQLSPAASTNGAAGTISLLFIGFAMVFGLIQKKAASMAELLSQLLLLSRADAGRQELFKERLDLSLLVRAAGALAFGIGFRSRTVRPRGARRSSPGRGAPFFPDSPGSPGGGPAFSAPGAPGG